MAIRSSSETPRLGTVRRLSLRTILTLVMFGSLLVLAVAIAVGTQLAMGQAEQRFDRLGIEGQRAVWNQTLENEHQRLRSETTSVTRNQDLLDALAGDEPVGPYAAPLDNRLRAGGVADRVVVLDRGGQVRFDSDPRKEPVFPLADSALDDGRFHQGLHHVPGEALYAGLAVPVYRAGQPLGVVLLMRDLAGGALRSLAQASQGQAALLDREGALGRTAPTSVALPLGRIWHSEPMASRVRGDDHAYQVVHLPLTPYNEDYPQANVVLVRDITESVRTQELINTVTYAFALSVFVLIAVGLYAWLGRTLRPLRQAVDTLEEIGHGRFPQERLADCRVFEIASLQEATGTMAKRLERMLEMEEENARLAFRDALTDLPNRRLLLEHLDHAIHAARRTREHAALLLLDLDNFKTLNDTCGHSAGDQLLQVMAQRLTGRLRAQDIVARLGGDEFVILLEALSADRDQAAVDARALAGELLEALSQPVTIDGIEHAMSGSFGITVFPQVHDTPEELLKQADFAMYQAKRQVRNGVRFYDPEMQRLLQREAELERGLRQALDEGQLLIHLQPQVDDQGQITGAEALMRWPCADGSWVSPAEFIPVAEHSGQIVEIGRLALHQACATLSRWQANPRLAGLPISVNLSPHHLRQGRLLDEVRGLLSEYGVDPSVLQIEVTESVMVDATETLMSNLEALRALGIRLALDDFGTGYSSLGYLKRLPLDILKIDRSFVRDLETNIDDANIVATVTAIAHHMGLALVAEGVETEGQRAFLLRHGCHGFQGFLFHRPMPVAAFEDEVARQGEHAGSS